jgi:hypothetical protein
MIPIRKAMMAAFACILSLSAAKAFAQQGASGTDIPIIVMADDSDEHSIASNSSVSKYINTKIKEQFSRYHYYVVTQDAVAANQGFDFNRRMDTANVLRAAMMAKKSGQPEFDVRGVVIYKVYPRVKDLGFAKQMSIEIAGEVHDADANRYIGDFGPMTRTFPAPADCNDSSCISAIAREKSADIASIVADEARKKLALLTKVGGTGAAIGSAGAGASSGGGLVTTYNIRFENFLMPDVLKIKGVMEGEFPDFVRAGKMGGSEPIVEYGYISKAPQNKLLEWIYVLLGDLQIKDAKVIAEGNTFNIKRLASDLPPPPPPSAGGRFR